MAEIQDWMATAKPNPEWEEWCKAAGQVPDIGLFPDIASLRKWIFDAKVAMTAAMGAASGMTGVRETDHQVSMRDGHEILCRTYQPNHDSAGGSPLYVMFHGGGFCIGGVENEELLCRLLTSKLGMVCVNVDYRLAPEHVFPTAANDCYDATKWAAENATSLGADMSKGFVIGGTSAGGNLTAVVTHLWRDRNHTPGITGAHLMIPALVYHEYIPDKYKKDFKSWEQNKDAPILGQKACMLFLNNYVPKAEDRKDPLFSPFIVASGHKKHPPAYFQVCGMDPLRDEAMIFERLLREEEGVKTKLNMYPGLPHGFWSVAPQLKASEKFVQDSVKGVEWLLQQV
ncbi:hypothetical protein BAUCODRAFT_31136 [Baudoinia panamericana UAMH 10762]|uniref:Alpha/beta hydrolase fold-3 domain-containing protein n=1 Tax=Baudoinia panamericana (strain UAMH 10762) TaxID=717646 RepID=M2NHN3_BAUPA|nr:uncharacterized protein BAUCODRAFT_31136 [Baudoinia panamericana UAMH 10762]EMC98864.1 hypothetical protein BAUCODRAFT_31136 [Baudoinia panamericana UAMH 10762]